VAVACVTLTRPALTLTAESGLAIGPRRLRPQNTFAGRVDPSAKSPEGSPLTQSALADKLAAPAVPLGHVQAFETTERSVAVTCALPCE
jgi:hypothetical protein